MPLIVCSKCQAIDNTATGSNYWFIEDKSKVLCSECFRGKWHNKFPKNKFDPEKWKYEEGTNFIELK
jgi:hypothetical protein